MEYCILTELSRTHVTFSAYKGGEGGFVPYGETHRPLAVWFSGNSVVTGKDAKQQALMGTPNAFTDLFERMKHPGHFNYAGESHDNNKLVLYTLRAGMKEFLINELLGCCGDLEGNVASLPLVMMFAPDLAGHAAVVLSQLRDNGFSNVMQASEDEYLLRALPPSGNARLVLSSDGENLFGNVYADGKCMSAFALPKGGCDPRVEKLTRLVWERTQAMNDFLEFENELAELRRVANAFIMSGEPTLDGSVTLSNGQSYHYYLERPDLTLYSSTHDVELLHDIFSHIADCVADRRKCDVVLKGLAASNRYLQDILRPEFATVKAVEKTLHDAARALLLQDCKGLHFCFGNKPLPEPPGPTSTPEPEPPKGPTPPTPPGKRDERDFKALRMSIDTRKANNDRQGAEAEADRFLQQMHEKGVTAFDGEVLKLLEAFKASPPATSTKPGPPTPPPAAEPSGKDLRAMKMLRLSTRTLLANGKTGEVKAAVENVRKEMHAKGITAFDAELDQLAEMGRTAPAAVKPGRPSAVVTAPKPAPRPQTPRTDEALLLMREGKFKEAREAYRSKGQNAKADDCTKIIRWQKIVHLYRNELAATADTHNREKARSRAKEIEEYAALYKKYSLDATDLERLAADYKRIR